MNIVFLGTPEIAKVCLEKLYEKGHNILAVVTNPDKPTGRGNKLTESPVKTFAKSKGLKVLQYESISKEGVQDLKALKPDALVLVAFGQILSEEILSIALPINLHGSLLPALRGPSPIQTAILEGLTQTGVSVMKMEKGVDTGDVILQKTIDILPEDNSSTLFAKMADLGADALCEALESIENGTAVWKSQDHQNATFTKMLTKENAKLDFADTAQNIVNKVRAYNPNPVAFFELDGQKFKVFEAKVVKMENQGFQYGQIALAGAKTGLVIKAQDDFVEIVTIQAPNGKKMLAKDFLNGKKIEVGARV
ncbi:MAG: methionyl-tRNA formyltransferase [Clostridia bacterium]|nr:methionyl-tRNA formyltransferase [Clostridia bacterium]